MSATRIFANISIKKVGNSLKPHKPLLLLICLSKVRAHRERLISFRDYDSQLRSFEDIFGSLPSVPPFGRLLSEQLWEIPNVGALTKNSSGDFIKSELISQDVKGGFTSEVYDELINNPEVADRLADLILDKYIDKKYHKEVRARLGLYATNSLYQPVDSLFEQRQRDDSVMENGSVDSSNQFITYLNSLHNLDADGANALAESQAVNPYFGDLYEPFPLVPHLKGLLRDSSPRVVILSGHAGDGKSTVALDIYKALRGLPPDAPLNRPLAEYERIEGDSAAITIVKDMSELGIEQRSEHLTQAFEPDSGSWLIVSNTGPLLSSLGDYAQQHELGEVEDQLLAQLDQPLLEASLQEHEINGFGKPLHIINLSRFDNTEVGSRVLTRLIEHPGWSGCDACSVQAGCPIVRNRNALYQRKTQVEERVRWLYRRVTEYDQRLTLRQMVAQLAFAITAGLDCADARARIGHTSDSGTKAATQALGDVIFSEGFFGFRSGHPYAEALGLRPVPLFKQAHIGGPVSPKYERQLQGEENDLWVTLPDTLAPLAEYWRTKTDSPTKRAALRRMLLLFGDPRPGREGEANAFVDGLLRSPGLRLLDESRRRQRWALSRKEEGDLLDACRGVLREAFSGFASSQFHRYDKQLYLTLRRPDRAVVQPTQLVIGSLSFRDFFLEYDQTHQIPLLVYQRGRGGSRVELALSLPLLDYILRRADGELGAALAPIHQAQLDTFQGELLRLEDAQSHREGEITLLRADIGGVIDVYNYLLDEDGQRLVKQR